MAFQIKDFPSIVAAILNRMRSSTTRITDFNIGSVARTMIEGPAAEIDEFYQQIFHGLKEAIPVATYNSFDFAAKGALPASGTVRVSISPQTSDVLISAGTVFKPPGSAYSYATATDFVIESGDTTADVLAAATVGGIATNLVANTSMTINPTIDGFVEAHNLADWNNGTDAETEDERKLRFTQFIGALPRGTVAAVKYGSRLANRVDANGVIIEEVRASEVIEPWLTDVMQPISLVNLFVHNGVGSTTSQLVERCRQVIYGYYEEDGTAVPGWKAAGVKVVVAAAEEVEVDIEGVLTPSPGYELAPLVAAAEAALSNYLLSLDIGKPFQIAQAIVLVKRIAGVANFILSDPAPTADVTCDADQKLMPGTFTITGP